MKIIELIKQKQRDLHGSRQPVIAFLGDSVTQGCFDLYMQDGRLKPYTASNKGYHERVREIFQYLYPEVPIAIINAGISGDSAKGGRERLDRDVLSFRPDLVVVCFGLNDACLCADGIEVYRNSLKDIFERVIKSGAELIFMTPNVRTDSVDMLRCEQRFNEVAGEVAKNEKDGWLDRYLESARDICREMDVPVCDCNRMWKVLRDNEVDINKLLSNQINHPTEELHKMFAYELVRIMFGR